MGDIMRERIAKYKLEPFTLEDLENGNNRAVTGYGLEVTVRRIDDYRLNKQSFIMRYQGTHIAGPTFVNGMGKVVPGHDCTTDLFKIPR